MGLGKAIESGKERRKKYRKSKRFDRSCRNNGSCAYCRANRLASRRRKEEQAEQEMEEYMTLTPTQQRGVGKMGLDKAIDALSVIEEIFDICEKYNHDSSYSAQAAIGDIYALVIPTIDEVDKE